MCLYSPSSASSRASSVVVEGLERCCWLQLPCFHLILLGMGPDGHCVRSSPGYPLLEEKTLLVTS
uniref:Glucosamine/galactosamine-6-phosphate isomerase domain-containing protein n=1 Tax=Peronospora matthiolae TaxID=2874970 RepID=A0AAV1UB38_9STRA